MTSNSTVVPLCQSDAIDDPKTAILRSGARRLLPGHRGGRRETFLATMKGAQLPDGRERLVRHGLGPERVIETGTVRSKSSELSCATAAPARGLSASELHRRSCHAGRGGRRAWMPCCASSICAGLDGRFQEALGALLGRDAPACRRR